MGKAILFTVNGTTKKFSMEAEGYRGPTCEAALDALATKLKLNVLRKDDKPEYFEAECNVETDANIHTG